VSLTHPIALLAALVAEQKHEQVPAGGVTKAPALLCADHTCDRTRNGRSPALGDLAATGDNPADFEEFEFDRLDDALCQTYPILDSLGRTRLVRFEIRPTKAATLWAPIKNHPDAPAAGRRVQGPPEDGTRRLHTRHVRLGWQPRNPMYARSTRAAQRTTPATHTPRRRTLETKLKTRTRQGGAR
jgi:hypothetical protein